MKKITTLGALVLTATILTFGLSAPAQAATLTGSQISVTSTGGFNAGQTNSTAVEVTVTTLTAILPPSSGTTGATAVLRLNGGVGWVTAPTGFNCGSYVTITTTPSLNGACLANNGGVSVQFGSAHTDTVAVGTVYTFTFAPGALRFFNAPNFSVDVETKRADGSQIYDSGSLELAISGYTAPAKTVTFDANGGAGATASQTASAATALTSNGFSRDGYSFSGWNTAADGTGTAYADGASYAFTRSVTLYAQWQATLASTGFDGQPYLLVGNLLGVLGVAVLLINARRRQTS